MSFLLEVIASSVEDALEAEAGGAGRIELCIDLEHGGLTPPIAIVREVLRRVRTPVRVMICEDPSYDRPQPDECSRLALSMRQMADAGVNGVVLGFGSGNTLDEETLKALIAEAPHVPITFHRVIERFTDLAGTVRKLKVYPQVDRVLLCRADWDALLAVARPEIELIAGGGLRANDFAKLLKTTSVREFHTGRPVREQQKADGRVTSRLVRDFIHQINSLL